MEAFRIIAEIKKRYLIPVLALHYLRLTSFVTAIMMRYSKYAFTSEDQRKCALNKANHTGGCR